MFETASIMECSFSSRNDDSFVLKFSDDESKDPVDQTDNYDEKNVRVSKTFDSYQLTNDFAQMKLENSCELDDLKINQTLKEKSGILPQYALQKLQKSPWNNLKNDNISDRMVNFPKLIDQLLNAKVVIERMCVSSQRVKKSEKLHVLSNKMRLKDSIQRYCPKCKTTKVDKHMVSVTKSCTKCETSMTYLCSKCNIMQCKSYKTLAPHWNRCGLPDFSKKLMSSDFLVERAEIKITEQINRYCLKCDAIDASCEKWKQKECRKCNGYLLYQCNKCKAQYNCYSTLLYHLQNKCYPSRYNCNQCDFTHPTWVGMHRHVLNVHSVTESWALSLDAKVVLIKLEESVMKDLLPRAVRVHAKVVPVDEKTDGTNSNDTVKRYCAKCKKTTVTRLKDSIAKNCSDCKTVMTYLCTKCNEKHFKRYPFLLFHLEQCKGNDDISDTSMSIEDCTGPNVGDKNMNEIPFDVTIETMKDRSSISDKIDLSLDKSQFIVKEFQTVDTLMKWDRYCSKCDIAIVSRSTGRHACSVCKENTLFICKKCDTKYRRYDSMTYHSDNQCFPSIQYKCTNCEYSSMWWKSMCRHFNTMHIDQPFLKCEFCPYITKYRSYLSSHTKKHAQ